MVYLKHQAGLAVNLGDLEDVDSVVIIVPAIWGLQTDLVQSSSA